MDKTYDSPLWSFETIEKEGIKIKPMLVVLPDDEKLVQIELLQHFEKAIVQQVTDVILSLSGHSPSNMIMSSDFVFDKEKSVLVKDEDLILLCFIKTYYCTTRTVGLALTNKGGEQMKKFDDPKETNVIIKQAKCNKFIDLKLLLSDKMLRFCTYGNTKNNLHLEELAEAKTKLY